MDNGVDMDIDGQWLTYTELAAVRGIDKPSAIKLASRRRWRRRKDNRGTMQVYVPEDWLSVKNSAPSPSMDPSSALSMLWSMDMSRSLNALETAVSALREQLDREKGRADRTEVALQRAEQQADTERNRADAAIASERTALARLVDMEAALTGERERTETTAKTLAAERAARLEAEAEITRARSEASEAAQAAASVRLLLREAADNLTAERAAKAAVAEEIARLRQAAEQAGQEAEGLRAEVARVSAQAKERDDRPSLVASKIDEAQFRRLQEAEQARKTHGLLTRLRLAWRGE